MRKLLIRPHVFFWGVIPIILLAGMYRVNDSIEGFLDINVHDTYFVVDRLHLLGFMVFLFVLLGLGYWGAYVNKRKLINGITFLHILLTFISLISFLIILFFPTKNEIISNNAMFDSLEIANIVLTFSFLLFLIGQLFYPINILSALIRKKND
ncbi:MULTISPECIES: hypothetical protein [unclassified Tenacibaculum]|uniref:hypothetical protein n=1 Tax=unclassified Tenacibaculum TaxID=2635139 RepID=UPI001F46E650|nr:MULTISPECIES: hypothetical protein [unclassified Tenacibaculum]MCF2876216.1 hypothetical protein [Tenacibaculum sp. Cn5-1]MCF2936291.1 hypothetical protein [Tenacibaculum sp. Cn5-34]MCG7511634.1 hypothetical protein [Tenacibaculum sp. Cn5-46]